MLVWSLEKPRSFLLSRRECARRSKHRSPSKFGSGKVAIEKCQIIVSSLGTVFRYTTERPDLTFRKKIALHRGHGLHRVYLRRMLSRGKQLYYTLLPVLYVPRLRFSAALLSTGGLVPSVLIPSYRGARNHTALDVLWCTWVKCRREVKWDRYGARLRR